MREGKKRKKKNSTTMTRNKAYDTGQIKRKIQKEKNNII